MKKLYEKSSKQIQSQSLVVKIKNKNEKVLVDYLNVNTKELHRIECEQVIYLSTASVLNNENKPLKEAGEIGTDYIRSKYDCLHQIEKLAIFPKITTVFPTLVLGGDDKKPGGARKRIQRNTEKPRHRTLP